MSALPDHPPLLRGAGPRAVSRELVSAEPLAACVRALDPGSRALLDLSLRRRLPLEAMALVLRTDPFDLARRRARAVARITAELDLEGPGVVAMVKSALAALPDDAWGVPLPAKGEPVQADQMKVQAAALMAKLRQRQLEEADRRAREAADAAVDDEIMDPLSLRAVFETALPPAAAAPVSEAEMLAPITEALRRAAKSERAASLREDVVEGSAETIEFVAVQAEPEPAVVRALTHAPKPNRGRIARGGLLVALLAALLRFLFRR